MAPDGRAFVTWLNIGRPQPRPLRLRHLQRARRPHRQLRATRRRGTLGGTDSSTGRIIAVTLAAHPLIGYNRLGHVYLLRPGGKPKQFARGEWIELQDGLAIWAHTPRHGQGRVYVNVCC